MQGATHHEAVSALRNAGSCIRMTVLRDRLPPPEVKVPGGPRDERDVTGQQLSNQEGQAAKAGLIESKEGCLSKSIEAIVCNGNDIVGYFFAETTVLFFSLWVTYTFHTLSRFLSLFLSPNGKMRGIRSHLN